MEPREWADNIAMIREDAVGFIRAQRVLDEINEELRQRIEEPFEEDFIDADAFGSAARYTHMVIDGVEFTVRKLHRRGLRQTDVKGADLLYEIAGRKFVLIQYKRVTSGNRVEKDANQLDQLSAACPNPCPPPKPGLWPNCGAWFAVHGAAESFYLPACNASSVFGKAASRNVERFHRGMSKETFQHLFARCWIGARTTPTEFAYLTWDAMERDRVLVSVLQRGTFGMW